MADLPDFGHKAYGVDLGYVGEEGNIIAHGHVPPLRFVAAANHMGRTLGSLVNFVDDRGETLRDVLLGFSHCWAVNDAERADADGFEWWLITGGITADTPGAFPVTLWAA